MKTVKCVEVTVRSVIDNLEGGLPVGDPEITVITARGSLTAEGEALSLKYRETEGEQYTDCELRLYSHGISLSRRGAVVCDLLFSEGEECSTVYSVPPYKFDMTVLAKRIRGSITDGGGELSLLYSMNIGGQDKSVRMKIAVKEI